MLNQEALEAARAAYQSAIPVRPWRADGGETDAPIRAAIRAYLSTLAPSDNGLVERLNTLRLKAFKTNSEEDRSAYFNAVSLAFQRDELIPADALTASQADRTALAAENERLRAEVAREAKLATEYAADCNEAEARAASLQTLLDKAVDGMRSEADSAYCRFISKCESTECLGEEAKIRDGRFGIAELNAHRAAHELLGIHRGIHKAITAIQEARHAGN